MNILDLLKNEERLLSIADFENKKIKADVEQIYANFLEMNSAIKTFDSFSNSQLNGEYHDKIVMVKSLRKFFNDWQGVVEAYNNFEKEEKQELENYYNTKTKLINSLTNLQNESLKEPVLSLYDLFNDELVKCEEGHEVIILGSQNSRILEYVINYLNENLEVKGNFEVVEDKPLSSNYGNVNKNVEMCNQKVDELFAEKLGKQEKFKKLIENMEEVAKKIVDFMTFKQDLISVGCSEKALNDYEKAFTKQYMPLKKTLQKSLKIEMVDICDVVVDENDYSEFDEDDLPNSFESSNDVTNKLNENYLEEKPESEVTDEEETDDLTLKSGVEITNEEDEVDKAEPLEQNLLNENVNSFDKKEVESDSIKVDEENNIVSQEENDSNEIDTDEEETNNIENELNTGEVEADNIENELNINDEETKTSEEETGTNEEVTKTNEDEIDTNEDEMDTNEDEMDTNEETNTNVESEENNQLEKPKQNFSKILSSLQSKVKDFNDKSKN